MRALALEGITIGRKPLKDHLEAIGHRHAFNFLQEVVGRSEDVSERLVKELHALVLADQPQDLPVSIKYEDQPAHYDAFTSYHQNGHAAPMIRIFAEAEARRLSKC